MEEKTKKKKLLKVKVTILIIVVLFISLFCIIIFQIVKINELQREIDNLPKTTTEATES